MSRERDPLAPPPHWRVDVRLIAELPEDNLVGTRFLVHVGFSALAVTALIFAGWLGYRDYKIRHEISDWERRIRESAAEVRDIQNMQKKYAVEAAKIDQAWTLIRPQLRISEFLADLGRTRPEQLVIDIIEWNEAGIAVRCNIRESSEAATRILGNYVRLLNRDEKISPLFNVVSTDLARAANDGVFKCEITFRVRAPK
jgi:exoribonuclease R